MKQKIAAVLASEKSVKIIICLIIFFISYFIYFRGYENPRAPFWDENYHIASAQKYLDGVMFMEPHPPLGKMFIALGEYILKPNKQLDTSSFDRSDFLKNDDIPEGYSWQGVRFFPALFGCLSAVVFFLILVEISGNYLTAFSFSSLYIFENSLVLQSRSAMLDSVQIFFMLLAVLYFFILINKKSARPYQYLVFGLLAGLSISVKVNSAILVLLFPFLFFSKEKIKAATAKELLSNAKNLFIKGTFFALGILFVFSSVFYIHFIIGKRIIDNRVYGASEKYQDIVRSGKAYLPSNFPRMIAENLIYSKTYEANVPAYDSCKPEENGSLPLGWPFGNSSINYRWAKTAETARYLYFQGNPIVWASGLVGVFLSFALILSVSAFRLPIKNKKLFFLISTFSTLYAAYMAVMYNATRVMYLYHYLIPLIFSLLMFYMLFHYIFEDRIKNEDVALLRAMTIFIAIIIVSFIFFAPFTYYMPLTPHEFHLRQWFDFWKLKSVM